MTIQDLWKSILSRVKEAPKVKLVSQRGKKVGVDISVWIHQILAYDEVVLHLLSAPAYRPHRLLKELERRHGILVRAGIVPLYVFDGCDHPMKSATREERDSPRAAARQWLADFYERGKTGGTITDEEREEAMKHMKTACGRTKYVTSLIIEWMRAKSINYFCAPFEAEWQLVRFQRDGKIDLILTIDGDAFALGATHVIADITLSNESCCLFDKERFLKSQTDPQYNISPYLEIIPEVATFLGNDYMKRKRGFGPATLFSKILPAYSKASDKEAYLLSVGIDAEQFKKTASLFRFAPVLCQKGGDWVLAPLWSDDPVDRWGDQIGFGVNDPGELLGVSRAQYRDAAYFRGCTFYLEHGTPLPRFPDPSYGSDEDNNDEVVLVEREPLPAFARLDFSSVPIPCTQSEALRGFADARRPYAVPNECDREFQIPRGGRDTTTGLRDTCSTKNPQVYRRMATYKCT